MNLRRIAKPFSAILLVVGLVTLGAAPADASVHKPHGHGTDVTFHKAHTYSPTDTGWGFK